MKKSNDLTNLFYKIEPLRKIGRLNLGKDLESKIWKTYFLIFVLERINFNNKIINIADYKLNYLDYTSCRTLFHETFFGQGYRFITSNRNPFIIDCGSNIGMSVLYFKLTYPSSRIVCFEPDEETFYCLEKNIEQNNLESVEANKKAVSGNEGKIEFYYDTDNPGSLVMSTIQERMPKQKREVDAVQLSNYVNEEVDFLKLDIEGAELDVIQELSNSGKLNYIKQMAIEYHHHIIKDEDVLSKVLIILENAGFGYQISSQFGRPLDRRKFQDILIYAYQKNTAA